jgi:hypothetical protein
MVAGLALALSVFTHSSVLEGEHDVDGGGLLEADADTDSDRIFGSLNTGLADANHHTSARACHFAA